MVVQVNCWFVRNPCKQSPFPRLAGCYVRLRLARIGADRDWPGGVLVILCGALLPEASALYVDERRLSNL